MEGRFAEPKTHCVEPTMRRRVAVIGAGPAGLTAAYELSKSGVHVEVFEADGCVGGLCRTISLWGQKVDLGPHRFFSSDPRVNRVWLEVVGRDYAMVDRLTRIHYKKRFFRYPIKPLDTFTNLGVCEVIRCIVSYGRQQIAPQHTVESFEDWVVQRFGRRLYEIFFKTYSEKLWGFSCRELDADFAAQRIKKLSLFEAIKNAITQRQGPNAHKTLVDRFAYPIGGTGMVYERMAESIERRGGKIHLRRPVARVEIRQGGASGLELHGGEKLPFDTVVSTMPMTLLVKTLPDVPAAVQSAIASLRFRNTILVYLNVDGQKLFPDNWLYIHSADLQTGRVTNFRNWVPQLYGSATTSILALEFWCNDEDALWKEEDAKLIYRAETEIRSTGLIGDSGVLGGHVHRIRRCYPVYRRGYKQEVAAVATYLKSIRNLAVIGRYGSFKYNNQDHSILMGLLCADNLVRGSNHDLWSINTDYETYQEASVITETGLEATPVRVTT
jgi:protoporphyrinogen oxidase